MITRRRSLQALAGVASLPTVLFGQPVVSSKAAAKKAKYQQSIVHWCFARGAKWKLEDTIKAAKELGCTSVEGVSPEHWPLLKENGLKCAYVGGHGFVKGMNNPIFWDHNLQVLHERIDQCAEYGNPNVISFTGFYDTTSDGGSVVSHEQGIKNCVEAFKKLCVHAEKKGVNIILEHLNSRVDEEMKGHPGYQGDHLDTCLEIIRKVDSPRMKLLFDFYHVQIMHGDTARWLEKCFPYISHIHTAGNPGRCELGGDQEMNYRFLMNKLADLGYDGFVGHEFIPTKDPMEGLREAVEICSV